MTFDHQMIIAAACFVAWVDILLFGN